VRCEWCGVFVRRDTKLARWRSKDAWDDWHDHEALLCPRCRKSAYVSMPYWVPID
jgi:hypothetical protein